MKYFIGYLIEREAAAWHIDLAKSISEKFNTWKLHEKFPPHITIFQTFDTQDIGYVKGLLRDWVQGKSVPGNFTLSGFDRFDDKVVFATAGTDQLVGRAIEELRKRIKEVPGMPEEDFPVWHPHATLANHLSSQVINQVWNYILTIKKPNFVIPFDNVTIFRFENDGKWVAEQSFKLSPSA